MLVKGAPGHKIIKMDYVMMVWQVSLEACKFPWGLNEAFLFRFRVKAISAQNVALGPQGKTASRDTLKRFIWKLKTLFVECAEKVLDNVKTWIDIASYISDNIVYRTILL